MPKRRTQHDQPATKEAKPSKQAKLSLDGKITTKDDNSTSASQVRNFSITSADKEVQCERRGKDGKPDLIFTHGAGGGLSNAATKDFAEGFAEKSPVVSFQGNMNMQGRVRGFQAVLEHEDVQCAVGGRSMGMSSHHSVVQIVVIADIELSGARAAVLTAQQSKAAIKSLILVSYPMVGAQKGDSREQILLDLPEGIDVVFISGSNDSMCSIEHLQRVMKKMKARTWLIEVQSADHGMSLKPKTGTQQMVKHTGLLAAEWLENRDESKKYRSLSWKEASVVSTGWQTDANKK